MTEIIKWNVYNSELKRFTTVAQKPNHGAAANSLYIMRGCPCCVLFWASKKVQKRNVAESRLIKVTITFINFFSRLYDKLLCCHFLFLEKKKGNRNRRLRTKKIQAKPEGSARFGLPAPHIT